ncbi:Gldg family protein [uncultured Butyricimonas sp.]|uniref:Gldg family protein n=1 Tax=uncultured Butyricimonas sp. TaxID=1268785 RepID=UPI0026DBE07A|nr:Gldg family protein [uncultured Butyricimonas sp.]
MKVIFKIAKSELSMLFYSPVAWLILVIFTFQASMAFSNLFSDLVVDQAIGNRLWDVTEKVFSSYRGLLSQVQQYLYLYIPLLTMGLMSKERNNGSIKLLFSSPITNTQIILGKYFAIMIYALVLIAILFVYAIFGMCTIKDMDVPYVLSGLFGLYLLTCAYAAIGLFMSNLTSYQVVAAMCTLGLLAVLNFIGGVGQDIPFLRDVTYWLSIRGRSNELIGGLICSEDVLYFIIVVVLFLMLSILKLRGERKKTSRKVAISRYFGVVMLAVFLGYLSSLPAFMGFYDATVTKQRTLTPNSQDVMRQLKGGLKITTYVNLLEPNYATGLPQNINNDKRLFRQYFRFKPEMKMKYVYYYDKTKNESLDQRYPLLSDRERAQEIANGLELNFKMFLSPEEIKKQVDLSEERNRFVRLIEHENGQKSFLRIFDDMSRQPREKEITAAMKRMVVPAMQVAFLSGHGERDIDRKGDRGYYVISQDITYREALINNGFDSYKLFLNDGQKIPENTGILIIADVRQPFEQGELDEIQRYIDRGGNLIIAGEPDKQEIMNPLLSSLGVRFMPGRLVQESEDFTQNLVFGKITREAADIYSRFRWMLRWNYRVPMPDVVGLEYSTDAGFDVMPILETDSTGCWNELETTDFSEGKAVLHTEAGEKEQTYALALALSRKVGEKEQRIFVMGDADCFSNGEFFMKRRGVNTENQILPNYVFFWLSGGEYPIDTTRPNSPDTKIYMGLEGITWMNIGLMGLFPLALAVCGIVIWAKRRRK